MNVKTIIRFFYTISPEDRQRVTLNHEFLTCLIFMLYKKYAYIYIEERERERDEVKVLLSSLKRKLYSITVG